MCGRFTLIALADLSHYFPWINPPEAGMPRYNIAPSQPVLAGVAKKDRFEFDWLLWGLVPPWAKDPAVGSRMINARAETLTQRPAYRNAFKRRRCLIPADGFYEWKKAGAARIPHYFRMRDRSVFAFAGLYEHWADDQGNELSTCTLITTSPNELVRPIHDRMPAILAPADHRRWLTAPPEVVEELQAMLRPYPAGQMTVHAVGRDVGNPRNDSPRCVEPVEPETPPQPDLFSDR